MQLLRPPGDPPNRPAFELRVLGPFELVNEPSGAAVAVPTAKMRALLAYLAAAPRATESRRRLAGLLWADRGEERARHSMRQMLSNFRRSAGGEVLLAADEDDLAVDPSLVAVDRAALMVASAETDVARMAAIADLYRGDFAAGLEIGEPEFDAWLATERTRCREAVIALLDRLVRALAGLGRHEEALRRAIRLAEIDPLREETLRLVMVEEAIVSGRASAMRRYEAFRVLLKDELGIRPEAATLRLLDDLRRQETAEPALPAVEAASERVSQLPEPVEVRRPRWAWWRASGIAAGLLIVLAAVVAEWVPHPLDGPRRYIDEDTGRASIILLPFEAPMGDDNLKDRARAYEAETRLAVARTYRLTVIDPPVSLTVRDAVATGRSLRALYVVRTSLVGGAAPQADIDLLYSPTGANVAVASVPMTGPPLRFADEMYRDIYEDIVLHRARTLAASSPDSIPGLLWRGYAAQIRTRMGLADPDAFALFEAVLKRDRNQLHALLALAESFILRAARQQSPNRAADLARAASLILRARGQAPNLAEIAFREGMIDKMRHRYEPAIADFERTTQLDPANWSAKAQIAHVKMFLGRLDEAYNEMEALTPDLAEIPASENGYIAGETALVAGHTDRALAYLDVAVAGNPTVARLQALYAAALWMAGRPAEAHRAALLSQTLVPPFTPDQLSRRGGPEADPRYRAARDLYVAALRSALAWSATN